MSAQNVIEGCEAAGPLDDAASLAGAAEIPLLDLFAGAGGLSQGLAEAGLSPVAAVEMMESAARTYEELHGFPVDRRRIESIPDRAFGALRGQIRVVAGGPPCQPWSTGGLRRGHDDDRDGFWEMLRAIRLTQPEAFLIENVSGLKLGKARPYYLALLDVLREQLGYDVRAAVLDAADFGVPQHRRRLFIVGMKGKQFEFPEPTHGPGRAKPWMSAGTVMGMEPVGEPNRSIVTYAKNPDLRPSPYDGLLFNGGGRPIDLTGPSRTILASAGGNKTPFIDTVGVVPDYHASLWPDFKTKGLSGIREKIRRGIVPGARRITVAESAALQTFPPGMQFHGTTSAQYTLVGNAVPPTLAKAVGLALREALA